MSIQPTVATVAPDALDLLGATIEQLDMQAATLRAIHNAYPDVFAKLDDGIRSGLSDTRHLTNIGLSAVLDWREYLEDQANALQASLDNVGAAQ